MKYFSGLIVGLLYSVIAIAQPGDKAMSFSLHSSAFQNNHTMPAELTCEGVNVSPPLSWSGAPQGTKSFALIIEDPDAPDPAHPKMIWTHWVLFNIAPDVHSLPQHVTADNLPNGAQEGFNDKHDIGYYGPCPPIGEHRYMHKLYALDTTLNLSQPTRAQLLAAMKGHILAETMLIGLYEK